MNAQMDFIETLTKQNVLPLCKFTFFHNKKPPNKTLPNFHSLTSVLHQSMF